MDQIKNKTLYKIDIQQFYIDETTVYKKLSYSKAIHQCIRFAIHPSEYFHSNIDAALFFVTWLVKSLTVTISFWQAFQNSACQG